jgi:hypothetical protein
LDYCHFNNHYIGYHLRPFDRVYFRSSGLFFCKNTKFILFYMENITIEEGKGITYTQNGEAIFVPQNLGEKFVQNLQNILQKNGSITQYGYLHNEAQKGLENVATVFGKDSVNAMALTSGTIRLTTNQSVTETEENLEVIEQPLEATENTPKVTKPTKTVKS